MLNLKDILPKEMGINICCADIQCSDTFCPDAVLTYKKRPICMVKEKRIQFGGVLQYLSWMRERMVHYCQVNKLSFILLIDDKDAYVLREANDYQIEQPVSLHEALAFLDHRMCQVEENVGNLGKPFFEILKKIIKDTSYLDKKTTDRLDRLILDDCDWDHVSTSGVTVTLSRTFEFSLFTALLGEYSSSIICRYTTREALYRVLSTKKQSLCSIVGMNDTEECNYVDNYFKKLSASTCKSSILQDSYNNEYYISSCTWMDQDGSFRSEDNLSMWRMYADDCKGVCLIFEISNEMMKKNGFALAPISYAKRVEIIAPCSCNEEGETIFESQGYENKHPELDFLYNLLHTQVGGYDIRLPSINFWKHFFKGLEYKDEKEVRLLYKGNSLDQKKWILANNVFCPIVEKDILDNCNEFPLVLTKIILGPKFAELEVNLRQIQLMVSESGIKNASAIQCVASDITNYR